MRVGLLLDLNIHAWFHRHGKRVAKHPWKFLTFSFLITLTIIIFSPTLPMNGTWISAESDRLGGRYSHAFLFGTREYVEIIVERVDGGNILTKTGLEFAQTVEKSFRETQGANIPTGVLFQDLCTPTLPQLTLDLNKDFRMTTTNASESCQVWSLSQVQGTLTKPINKQFTLKSGEMVPVNQMLAGVVYDASNNITSATSNRMVFDFRPFTQSGKYALENTTDNINMFMSDFRDSVLKHDNTDGFRVFFFSNRVFTDVLGVALAGGSFLLILIMLMVGASFKCNNSSRMITSFAGFLNVVMALLMTGALFNLLGIETSLLMATGSAIVLCIGVDDVYVLLAVVNRSEHLNPDKRLSHVLGEAGSSILMTTATDVIVFFCGFLVDTSIAGRNFNLHVLFALAIDFILMITFMAAVMHLDFVREYESRHACCCCFHVKEADTLQIKVRPSEESNVETNKATKTTTSGGQSASATLSGTTTHGTSERVEPPRVELEIIQVESNKSSSHRSLGTASATTYMGDVVDEDIDASRGLTRNCSIWFGRLSATKPCKAFAIFVLLIICTGSVMGLINLTNEDYPLHAPVKPTSQHLQFLAVREKQFPQAAQDMSVIFRNEKWWESAVQTKILKICDSIDSGFGLSGLVLDKPVQGNCWLRQFLLYANDTDISTSEAFHRELTEFVRHGRNQRFRQDLLWQNGKVVASKVKSWVKTIERSLDSIDTMNKIGADLVSLVSYEPFAFVREVRLKTEYLWQLGVLACLGVTIACCFFLINPLSALLVTLSMFFSCTTIYGFGPLFGAHLSQHTLTVCGGALGFGVDFTAHFVKHFMVIPGQNKQRTVRMFFEMGPSVLFGFLSSASLLILAVFVDGVLYVAALTLGISVTVGWMWAWIVTPMILQFLDLPVALRDFEMEAKMRRKMDGRNAFSDVK